jgi:hypothetical protein
MSQKQRLLSIGLELRTHGSCDIAVVEVPGAAATPTTGSEGAADLHNAANAISGYRSIECLLLKASNSRNRPKGVGGNFPVERPVHSGSDRSPIMSKHQSPATAVVRQQWRKESRMTP